MACPNAFVTTQARIATLVFDLCRSYLLEVISIPTHGLP
jgi:hypothetical protein